MQKVFNALCGPELIEVLKDRLGRALEATGEFKPNVTFPWVEFDLSVKVLAYPQQGKGDEPRIKVRVIDIVAVDERPADLSEKHIQVSDNAIIDTPDKARVESGQPIPIPAPGPGGALVDKFVARKGGKK